MLQWMLLVDPPYYLIWKSHLFVRFTQFLNNLCHFSNYLWNFLLLSIHHFGFLMCELIYQSYLDIVFDRFYIVIFIFQFADYTIKTSNLSNNFSNGANYVKDIKIIFQF